MRLPGWRWKWAGRASLEDRPSLLVTGGPWLMRRKVTGRIPSSLQWACQGRIGCLPRLHWSAPLVSIYAALTGRTPSRYGRAHSQAASGALPVSMQATWLGALPVLLCCLPAVCVKWSGALPPQAYATTRHSPRLGALPGLRWQRERLQCQRHLVSVYTICPAGLAPWLLLASSRSL